MDNLQDFIGFLEHLKSLNKTKIEIDSVLTNLVKIKEKQLSICGVGNLLNFDIEKGDRVLYKKIETFTTGLIKEGEFKGRYEIKTERGCAFVKKEELILVHKKI